MPIKNPFCKILVCVDANNCDAALLDIIVVVNTQFHAIKKKAYSLRNGYRTKYQILLFFYFRLLRIPQTLVRFSLQCLALRLKSALF